MQLSYIMDGTKFHKKVFHSKFCVVIDQNNFCRKYLAAFVSKKFQKLFKQILSLISLTIQT